MKRKSVYNGIALIILLSGLLYFIAEGKKSQQTVVQPAVAGHEAHSTGGEKAAERAEAKSGSEEEAPAVEIPPDMQRMIGVRTVATSVKSLQTIIRTVGRIEYDERKIATVNTKFEGWIEKLFVDYAGKSVRKGEPLAEIYSPELFATIQDYLTLIRWPKEQKGGEGSAAGGIFKKDREMIIEAAKQRLRLWDITDEQINRIADTGKAVRTVTLYSPVNGYVIQKMAFQGMRVMPGEKLYDIADLSSLWVIADIYEYELPLITPGQSAKITLSHLPGKEIISVIDYIYPAISGETRTAKVRFAISNHGEQIKPQMLTNVEIRIDAGKRLAIPNDAVIDTGTRQVVYVDRGEGYFEPREVRLGLRAEGLREVISGLKAGEKVASSATFLIDAEAQLKNVTPLSGHKH